MKRMIDDRSNRHMNIYILQFINYLHQYRRAIESIVPLFVRKFFFPNKIFYFISFILALSC